jgi:hypothetical protein
MNNSAFRAEVKTNMTNIMANRAPSLIGLNSVMPTFRNENIRMFGKNSNEIYFNNQ